MLFLRWDTESHCLLKPFVPLRHGPRSHTFLPVSRRILHIAGQQGDTQWRVRANWGYVWRSCRGVSSGTAKEKRGITFSVGQKLRAPLPPNHLPTPNQPLWCIVGCKVIHCPVITPDSKRESGNLRSFENFRTLLLPRMTSSHDQNTLAGGYE